jgi:hypothetical protein
MRSGATGPKVIFAIDRVSAAVIGRAERRADDTTTGRCSTGRATAATVFTVELVACGKVLEAGDCRG